MESIKGFGKGLKMITLINKAITQELLPTYFLCVLLIRCLASAFIKSLLLKLLLKKKLNLEKLKFNFEYIALATFLMYLLFSHRLPLTLDHLS